jgi:phasin family protein
MNQTAKSFDTLAEAGSPPEVAAKQAELAKEAFEKAPGNMRELAEMVTKAQQGAIDTISGRISQSLDEIKDMALKMSCTRFLWTRHCRSRNREEQRDGQRALPRGL